MSVIFKSSTTDSHSVANTEHKLNIYSLYHNIPLYICRFQTQDEITLKWLLWLSFECDSNVLPLLCLLFAPFLKYKSHCALSANHISLAVHGFYSAVILSLFLNNQHNFLQDITQSLICVFEARWHSTMYFVITNIMLSFTCLVYASCSSGLSSSTCRLFGAVTGSTPAARAARFTASDRDRCGPSHWVV